MFPKSSPQRDGDELLLSLLMATSRVQDLQHLPSLVASFPGLGTLQSLGVPGGCNERPRCNSGHPHSSPDAAIRFLERVGTDLGLACQKVEVSKLRSSLQSVHPSIHLFTCVWVLSGQDVPLPAPRAGQE